MRESKFKAWDGKKWLGWSEIIAKIQIGLDWDDIPNKVQYTGYKDEDGKEIYQDDLLEIYMEGDLQNTLYLVESVEQLFFDCNTIDNYMRINDRRLKIIGNIYENPELKK